MNRKLFLAASAYPTVGRKAAYQLALLLIAGGSALWPPAALRAAPEVDPVQLLPIVTLANRVSESAATVGTAVEVLSGTDSARQQLTNLAEALWGSPGGPLFATGRIGASTSLFLRGANSDQVLFLVDGIRFSDANANYGPFLGSWRTGAADQLEVARGPQSTLYGAEAVGGVVALTAAPGAGHPTEWISAEAGSFGTVQGSVQAQGTAPTGLAYNASVAGGSTENGRPNNGFRSGNAVLRLDDAITSTVSVGGTVRALDASYGDPGDRFTNDLTAHEREEDLLGTVFAKARFSKNYSAQLTVGGQYRRFDSFSFGSETIAEQKRGVVDGQATAQLGEQNRLTAGADLETGHDRDSGFGSIDHSDRLNAVFADDEFTPFKDLHLTAGLRHDDYSTYGSVVTGRATAAWLTPGHFIKFRGSYGTGFNSPSFLDLYAVNPYFVGNPAVRPEQSRGWDTGFDWYLPAIPTQALAVTWFHTDYRKLIEDNFAVFPATAVNLDRALTEGLEAAWTGQLPEDFHAKVAYTYLVAHDITTRLPLLRRPRNSGSADLYWDLPPGWTLGAGGVFVGARPDVDARTFATVQDPGYAALRFYARWQVTRRLGIHARVENALDRVYEPVNGYPALRRGAYGGLDWKF